MKVAAYQAPLLPGGSMEAVSLIRERIDWCEAAGVEFLCCPEAVLGGLADNAPRPAEFALDVARGGLDALLASLASTRVTTILGFTEISTAGTLYNAAAIMHRGALVGVYRKLHPAIRKSAYAPGTETPVFTVGSRTFGVMICNDSNFPESARRMAELGATVLFIPTNNALPPAKADVVTRARRTDVACAIANGVSVVRADVAGIGDNLVSYGSSGIVDPNGVVLETGRELLVDTVVADIP